MSNIFVVRYIGCSLLEFVETDGVLVIQVVHVIFLLKVVLEFSFLFSILSSVITKFISSCRICNSELLGDLLHQNLFIDVAISRLNTLHVGWIKLAISHTGFRVLSDQCFDRRLVKFVSSVLLHELILVHVL